MNKRTKQRRTLTDLLHHNENGKWRINYIMKEEQRRVQSMRRSKLWMRWRMTQTKRSKRIHTTKKRFPRSTESRCDDLNELQIGIWTLLQQRRKELRQDDRACEQNFRRSDENLQFNKWKKLLVFNYYF